MRCVISVLLTLVVSISAQAAPSTALLKAHCKSLVLNAAVAVTTNELVTSAYFTTFDGRNVVPQHDSLPNGLVRMSDELRPRIGQPGIYDVDYAVVSDSDELLEYGSLMVRLVADDRDTNGISDILQIPLNGNSEITGTAQSDWPAPLAGNILGTLERETNTTDGSFAITVSRSNRVFVSGSFSLPVITGEVDYSPTEPSEVTFRLSITIAGISSEFTGTARCTVPNSNELGLEQFMLYGAQGRPVKVLPTVLKRVGTKFVGPLEFTDGNPETSWNDYISWVLEIWDSNDSNHNGIPDLSDTAIIVDSAPPKVRITSPGNGDKTTNGLVTISGTARDDVGVSRVECRVGTGTFAPVSGTTDWSAEVSLSPGTNVVEVRAIDAKGNISESAYRRINYVVYTPLIVLVNGNGSVVPHGPGKELVIGRTYTLRAVPQPGHLFSHWSGSVEGSQSSLAFVMQTNLAVIANFVPNPFITLAGGYEGLFSETATNRAESSGMLRLSLRANGTYTARLFSSGRTNAIVGRFNARGESTVTISQPRQGSTTLQLQINVAPGADQLTGTLVNSAWTASVLAYRAAFGPGENTNFAGRYTIRLAGNSNGSQSPGGDGFATAIADANGKVKVAGKLADGTAFTFGTALSRSGAWPFFAGTHRGKGVMMGWMRCSSPPDIAESTARWTRPAIPGAQHYPNGFTVTTAVSGSAYTNNPSLTSLLVIASGGGLAASVTNRVALATDGRFLAADPALASFKLNPTTGAFSGSFLAAGATYRFDGVMLQKQHYGAGFFPGTTSVGSIRVLPAP